MGVVRVERLEECQSRFLHITINLIIIRYLTVLHVYKPVNKRSSRSYRRRKRKRRKRGWKKYGERKRLAKGLQRRKKQRRHDRQ